MKHAELKALVEKLNELKLEGIESLRTVGVKGTVLKENFLLAIEEIDEKGMTDQLPDPFVDAYNELSKESEGDGDAAEAPVKDKPAKDKPAKDKPAKKKVAGVGKNKGAEPSRYGHVKTAVSGKLDDLLFAGNTVTFMMKELGIARTRVVNHVKHLKNDKGLKVTETKPEGKDVKLNDTHYQVEEEFWTK